MVTLCATMVGCPDPNRRLLFAEERKRDLTIRALDDQLRLRVSTFSGRPCGKYELYLTLGITTTLDTADIRFQPDEVRVLVADSVMGWWTEKSKYAPDDTARYAVTRSDAGRLLFSFRFRTTVDPMVVPEKGGLPVKIALNDFIAYKTTAVHFDTIDAMEMKRCDY